MDSKSQDACPYFLNLAKQQQAILDDNNITIMDDYRNHYEALEMSSQESDTCGQGECGPVRKMRHIASGRIDVIKTIPADPMGSQEVTLHHLAQLHTKHVAKIHNIFLNRAEQDDDVEQNFYLAVEYCANGSLFEFLRLQLGMPHDEDDIRTIFRSIAVAIDVLHTDLCIAHRDLKPENILVTGEGVIKLADFGFAREARYHTKDPNLHSQPACETQLGTAFYMAPEVLSNTNYDHSCDIWSLGVILHILLTGRAPFRSNTAPGNILSPGLTKKIKQGVFDRESLHDEISKPANDLLTGMLEVDCTKRISIGDVIESEWLNARPESIQLRRQTSVDLPTNDEIKVGMGQILAKMRDQADEKKHDVSDHNLSMDLTRLCCTPVSSQNKDVAPQLGSDPYNQSAYTISELDETILSESEDETGE